MSLGFFCRSLLHHGFNFRRYAALEFFTEEFFHLIVKLQRLPHIALLTISTQQEDIDAFIIGVMGNELPAVARDFGHVANGNSFLELLKKNVQIKAFKTVTFRKIPGFIFRGILHIKTLEETSLVKVQLVARVPFKFRNVHLKVNVRIDLDNRLPWGDKDIGSQELFRFINGIAEIFPSNGIGFIPPKDSTQLITHDRSFDENIIYEGIHFIVRKKDFLPIFFDYWCA